MMSVRSLNWLKFGGLVALAFALGLLFAGLLDLPASTVAQQAAGGNAGPVLTQVQAPSIPAAKPLSDLSDAFASVVEVVRPSVVYIRAQRQESAERRLPPGFELFPRPRRAPQLQEGSGSGFVVSSDGYILTNNHVVDGAERVLVTLSDRRQFPAEIVGSDANTDLAVLKVKASDLHPAALGDSDMARVGEWVLAIGNPLGGDLTFTVTSGIVSAKGRPLTRLPNYSPRSIQDFIQTDAAINPGNSGGPLVNVRGQVIGINSAIASETGYNVGYGFAIPINLARHVMDQLIRSGRVERAALGITIQDATANDAAYVGLPEVTGIKVQDFPENSAARRAGLEQGDVIIAVDGKPVEYTAQLQQEIGFRRPGDLVKVEVARKGGVRRTIEVRLQSLDEQPTVARADRESSTPDVAGTSLEPLGISVEPLTPALADRLQVDSDTRGLLVTKVVPGGPAWEVLESPELTDTPDIILSVEGKPVRTEAELRAALRTPGPGGIVSMLVVRRTRGGVVQRVERVRLSR